MLFDTSRIGERLLALAVRGHTGLDRLLSRLTGWSSPRNALILLVASLVADVYKTATGPAVEAKAVAAPIIWVLAIVPALVKLDRWVRSGQDTVPAFVDTYIKVSVVLVALTPVELLLEAAPVAGDARLLAAVVWETWLDLALISVAWNLTPPGRSVFASVADRIRTGALVAVPARK